MVACINENRDFITVIMLEGETYSFLPSFKTLKFLMISNTDTSVHVIRFGEVI